MERLKIRKEKVPKGKRGVTMHRMSLLVLIVLASLVLAGCGGGIEGAPIEPPTAERQQPVIEVPTVVAESQPVSVEEEVVIQDAEEHPCQGDRWEIIPIAIYQYPMGDGWKVLLIPLAVKNLSELWGEFSGSHSPTDSYLATEEGYIYRLYDGNFPKLKGNVQNPYEGDCGPSCWGVRNRVSIATATILPPRFAAKGDNSVAGYPGLWGTPDRWLHLAFRVAETQTQFKLTIQKANIRCIMPDGRWESELAGPFEFDLSSGVGSVAFPFEKETDWVYGDLSSPFEINGASLQITEVYRDDYHTSRDGGLVDDMVVIGFEVTNLSGGYEASGSIYSYLIGDDGLIRTPGCGRSWLCQSGEVFKDPVHTGSFYLGPGQTGEASIGFLVPPSVKNLKFVIADEKNGLWKVFDLPADL